MKELIRTVRFTPYRKGCGPTFTLRLYDIGGTRPNGQARIAYDLRMHGLAPRVTTLLFEGDDFGCSPLDAIDSDGCVRSLMTFLTLRPGDTDEEYFADYTDAQHDYCARYAETLGAECTARFGDD